ncbi:MAG: NADH-quinone oxidoreductase subunit H [Patescibacteria group bacterium]
MNTLLFIFQLLIVPALSPLGIGFIRKVKARMQNRVGASVFQPYRDLWKLFQKDEVISEDASWIFRFSPYLIFAITILIGASIPVIAAVPVALDFLPSFSFLPAGDFLVIIYLFALMTFFLALSGMDTGSAFGGFGSSREMMVAALAEAGLLFSLLAVSVTAESGNVVAMVGNLQYLPLQALFPLLIAFLAFIIALLAENARFPVDNPATHLELTMIHEAMILEHSGKRLALMEWAAANKLLIFILLAANLFFPWGVSLSYDSFSGLLVSTLLVVGKSAVLLFGIAFLESTMAKFRIFRVPDLLLTSFVLGVIALAISITF